MDLYKLSFPNGKEYIGITSKTAKERFKQHCNGHGQYAVHSAIRKYGKNNVVLTVLAECDNWELLCLIEQEAIDKFNTFYPNGYNLTLGGDGTIGINPSEKSRLNISIAQKQRFSNPEERDLARKRATGRKQSIETINKRRESMMGRIMSKESIEKTRQANIGKKHSEETKKKLSESHKNPSQETRLKMSIAQKNRSAESRKQSPESIKKSAEKRTGAKRTEEAKAKMRATKAANKLLREMS